MNIKLDPLFITPFKKYCEEEFEENYEIKFENDYRFNYICYNKRIHFEKTVMHARSILNIELALTSIFAKKTKIHNNIIDNFYVKTPHYPKTQFRHNDEIDNEGNAILYAESSDYYYLCVENKPFLYIICCTTTVYEIQVLLNDKFPFQEYSYDGKILDSNDLIKDIVKEKPLQMIKLEIVRLKKIE